MWFLAGAGVLLAGIVLMAGPLPEVMRALSTGVIVGKGRGAPRIERTAEPERFNNLLRQRLASVAPGAAIAGCALLWLAWNALAAWIVSRGGA
ncbi:MAG TPA: hypothetical protein VD994_09415 [Prosthecobacter sp.]|nr:hypothetical protein [Prosthecobacter sp.]